MRALLVANPNAGNVGGASGLARLEQRLRDAGMEVRRVADGPADEVGDQLAQALRQETGGSVRVLVAGGDGTINLILPALAGGDVPMAILPVGSVNVLARELGVPRQVDAAIGVAISGKPRRIDLGMANGRPFALMAGMGFDAAVVHSVAHGAKRFVGSLAYVARGLRVFASCPSSLFRFTADAQQHEARAWLAVVANAGLYTYRWRLAPEARIDDGWLDLCLFESHSAVRTLGQLTAALTGRGADYPGVIHLRARRFRFECDPPVPMQLDGDAAGHTPTEVEIAPAALTVMVPDQKTSA